MTDYTVARGPWGKPWITRDGSPLDWGPDEDNPADKPFNGHLYDRVSDLAGNLDTKENLSPYHQAQAITGFMRDRALAVQMMALCSEYQWPWNGAKQEVKALLAQARRVGGEDHKSGMGTGFHRYSMLRDKEIEFEYPAKEFIPWMDCYSEAMKRFEVLDWENFVVIDDLDDPDGPNDLRAAGSFDKLLLDKETGEVLAADLKTGKDEDRYIMKPTIQVAGYAHGERYDQETGRRWPLHEALSITKGAMIHVPFNGGGHPECIIYPLDLEEGWRLCQMSADLTKARKMRGYKRNVLARAKAPVT